MSSDRQQTSDDWDAMVKKKDVHPNSYQAMMEKRRKQAEGWAMALQRTPLEQHARVAKELEGAFDYERRSIWNRAIMTLKAYAPAERPTPPVHRMMEYHEDFQARQRNYEEQLRAFLSFEGIIQILEERRDLEEPPVMREKRG